jgi:Fe2+ transport system protein B
MTKREIARVKALLLSSGIKAKEIARRAAETQDLYTTAESPYTEIAKLAPEKVKPMPKSQEHLIAARILSDDIQLSKQVWQASADLFCNATIQDLIDRVEDLQSKIVENLTPMARRAADEADEVSKDLVTSQTLKVKRITDTMDKMLRRRRRRLRWLRRGGWVMVEWVLVGVMWMVWFSVVFVRVFLGIGRGFVRVVRWLLWL